MPHYATPPPGKNFTQQGAGTKIYNYAIEKGEIEHKLFDKFASTSIAWKRLVLAVLILIAKTKKKASKKYQINPFQSQSKVIL